MSEDRILECSVREGRFIDPCTALSDVTDNITPGFSKKKGVARWSLTSLSTHKPARSYFGVKCDAHPNGFLFNFCPFCGVKIDAPFNPAEPAQSLTPSLDK